MSETTTEPERTTRSGADQSRRFRILSLEGGGIMGAFSASILAELEEATGHRCIDHFDLIAGTSTGGIIAIGLGMGLPARQICDFYRDQGGRIFPRTGFAKSVIATLRHFIQPKHSQEALRQTLSKILRKEDGSQFKFGDSRVRLVIPTYDCLSRCICIFKTQHHPRLVQDAGADAVDVALATSAAPTYFSASMFPHHGTSYVDGGVWANCPALVAVTEAIHFLQVERTQIDILDIGTTTEPFNTFAKARSGVAGWNKGLINLFMTAQIEASRAISSLLTEGTHHKINHVAPKGMFSFDDASRVPELIGLGYKEAVKKENLEAVKQHFLDGQHAPPFEPVVAETV